MLLFLRLEYKIKKNIDLLNQYQFSCSLLEFALQQLTCYLFIYSIQKLSSFFFFNCGNILQEISFGFDFTLT